MRTLLAAVVAVLALAVPAGALAAVQPGQPFPSNLFTKLDLTQATNVRVNLAKPDCAARPSDCADIDVVNTLDGFNVQPRISIPFSAPIDVSTVSSETVFLVGLSGRRIGINQIVWEPAANTLHVESDEQLAARSPYLLIVTRGVHGADGERLDGSAFWRDLLLGHPPTADAKRYRVQLGLALAASTLAGVKLSQVAVASLFTTQSIAAISQKIRAQIRSAPPAAPSFTLGTAGERTVFPLSSITAIQSRRQVGTATFTTSFLPLPGASGLPRLRRHRRLRVVHVAGLRDRWTSSSRRSERGPGRQRRRGRTRSGSRSSCRRGRRRPAAGPSRSSGTASPTRRTARRGQSPRHWPTPGSRRSPSTWSGMVAERSARIPSSPQAERRR